MTSKSYEQSTNTSGGSAESAFIYDTERLRSVTTESVIRDGLRCYKEDRVTDLDHDDTHVWAQVEEAATDEPYPVELGHDPVGGELVVHCPCKDGTEPVCRHAVAVLYAFAAQMADDDVSDAADEAIKERSVRGRSEVTVKHVSGEPWFGTWQAASIVSSTHHPQTYTVHIRSLQERRNYCTCPDLATNQLGTCKHIEAVVHRIRKRRNYKKIKDQAPPIPYVYLAWDVIDAPKIRAQRVPDTSSRMGAILNRYFEASGLFRGRLPDDLHRFKNEVLGHADVHIGEDVQRYVERVAADVAHRLRAGEIRAQIARSGGVLPGIRARLYPYQVDGVAFLAANGRSLLADDMGLGKTLQAIAAATWLERNAEVARILVVCPASLKHQWAREIERFAGHEAQVIQGTADLRGALYRKVRAFTIVNYELVLRDLTVINETLRPDLLILDEAQRIKNWRTKVASSTKLIRTPYAFVLTGTPLENRLEDLYSLMQVVDPNVLGPLWRYMVDFHVMDERGKVLGYRNLTELRRRIGTVMLRRDRALVSDQLPERCEVRLDLPMTPGQQELHDAGITTAGQLAMIARKRPLTPSEQHRLIAGLQQARMACDAAGLVDKETKGSPKLDEIAELLEELCLQDGLKVVVFSEWERMTAMVERRTRELDIGCVRLHGGVPTARRGALMDRFRDDDSIQVFISTDAGGTGLNLQNASALINLDVPWNPAVLDQRIARVHRLGQKQKVQVFLMVAADSYEERVLELVGSKRDLFDNVVKGDASEDVVGVSKRMLQTLVDELSGELRTGQEQAPAEAEAAPPPQADLPIRQTPESTTPARDPEADLAVRRCIELIQQTFAERVERILASRGGLLVVMTPIEPADEQRASELLESIPVALIEPWTLAGLQRVGMAAPKSELESLYDSGRAEQSAPTSPLLDMAREKLHAAELLIEQRCAGSAMELLASAMLGAVAARARMSQAPSRERAAIWIYGEAIPKGYVLAEQASALVRAISLSEAPEVPDTLVFEVLEDARMLVAQTDPELDGSSRITH